MDNYRDDLTIGKDIHACLYCLRKPRFRQWPGRQLVIFEHRCKFVTTETTLFTDKADEVINDWNIGIQIMRDNTLKTHNAKLTSPPVSGLERSEEL